MSRSQGVCNQPLVLLPLTRTPRVNWLSILGEGRRPPRGSNWGTLVTVKSSSRPGRARARLLRNLHDYLSVISNITGCEHRGVEGRVGGMVGGPPIIRRDIASTPPPPRRHACPEPLNVGFVCVTVCRFAEAFVPTFPSGPSDTCNCQSPLYAPRSTPHRCVCQRRTCSFARSGSALGASPSLSQFRPWYGRVCV